MYFLIFQGFEYYLKTYQNLSKAYDEASCINMYLVGRILGNQHSVGTEKLYYV